MSEPNQTTTRVGRAGRRVAATVADMLRRTRLGRIEQRLVDLQRSSGGAAVYLGNNRVAVRVSVGRLQLVYLVEADDRLITPRFAVTGRYETATTAFLARALRADAHCVDAGANFGYFTCLMGALCPTGRVIAVEPLPSLAALARDNIAVNGLLDRATVIAAAVSNDQGPVTLYRRDTRQGNTSIVPATEAFTAALGEAPATQFVVPAVRIDDLLAQLGGRIDWLKLDIEGAEPLAIRGATQTIAANPQITIVMEWSPGQIASAGFDVRDFVMALAASGLRAFDPTESGRLVPLATDRLVDLPYRAGVIWRGPAAG